MGCGQKFVQKENLMGPVNEIRCTKREIKVICDKKQNKTRNTEEKVPKKKN